MSDIKFSLILATYGKAEFIELTLNSLVKQSFKDFELIIADQNSTNHLKPIVEKYQSDMQVKHLSITRPGLSHARNIAMTFANGQIISFPDDDCEYHPDTLSQVWKLMSKTDGAELDFVCTSCRRKPDNTLLPYTPLKEQVSVTVSNFFYTTTSIGIFIKREACTTFDEQFGLGSTYISCEEMDFVYRSIKEGLLGEYHPEIITWHPETKVTDLNKIKNNSMGHGALARKHMFSSLEFLWFNVILLVVLKPILGLAFSLIRLNTSKISFYKAVFLGRVKGFLTYEKC